MKFQLAIVLLMAVSCFAIKARYDNYKVYSIQLENEYQAKAVVDLEHNSDSYDFWSEPSLVRDVDIMVPPHKFGDFEDFLTRFDIQHYIKVENVQKLVDEQDPELTARKGLDGRNTFDWTFFNTFAEINSWLDSRVAAYPNVLTVINYGTSLEGRPLRVFRYSERAGNPATFIEANFHAREWASSAAATWIINELLTSNDPSTRQVANTVDWYIVVVANPDGFVFAHENTRLWRKTRRPEGSCIGTDPNSNFDFFWMTAGASNNPCSDTYTGPAPFSDPETAAMRDFYGPIAPRVSLFLSIHSFGQYILFPFGHTTSPSNNNANLMSVGNAAATAIRNITQTDYLVGISSAVLYATSGSSPDWLIINELGADIFSLNGAPLLSKIEMLHDKDKPNASTIKAPLPVIPWDGVLNCTAYGPVCWQANHLSASEDCLHLNVFTKNLPIDGRTNLKPVIAFLHGGGLEAGSPKDYGPEYLLDRDVVFVTINYRLGAFGFLALETEEIPGNARLKDQNLALKWIQRNIIYLGGDPQRVTLAAITSGSFAVTAHMISPMSDGLFNGAILTSGALAFNQKLKTNNFDLAEQLADRLNCSSTNISQITECLKNRPAADIANNWSFPYFRCIVHIWRPVVEQHFEHGGARFLTEQPNTLLREGNFSKVNVLTGTADELFTSAENILRDANATLYLNEHFNEIAPTCFAYESTETYNEKEIAVMLRKFYFPFDTIDIRSRSYLHQIFTDSVINHRVHKFVNYIRNATTVYYYKFTYVGRFSRFKYPRDLPYGVYHGDDLQYVFYPNIVGPNKILPSDPENFMVERMTRIWERFAATGNPNNSTDEYLSEMVWPQHDSVKELYLDIGNNLIEKNGKDLRPLTFWDDIFNTN